MIYQVELFLFLIAGKKVSSPDILPFPHRYTLCREFVFCISSNTSHMHLLCGTSFRHVLQVCCVVA